MAAKLITYDLNSPGQDYDKLIKAIKELGPWWHYLESTWLVDTRRTPDQIVEYIRKMTDKNDYLLVIDVTGDTHQGFLPKSAWDWINQHMLKP